MDPHVAPRRDDATNSGSLKRTGRSWRKTERCGSSTGHEVPSISKENIKEYHIFVLVLLPLQKNIIIIFFLNKSITFFFLSSTKENLQSRLTNNISLYLFNVLTRHNFGEIASSYLYVLFGL